MFNRVISKIHTFSTISLIALSSTATATMANWLGPEPIVGHCTSDKSAFDTLIRENDYVLKQTSGARDGRSVMFYAAEDFMIAVADEERSQWCIQFTSYDAHEFLEFLVGRYDPTTRGDEGTD